MKLFIVISTKKLWYFFYIAHTYSSVRLKKPDVLNVTEFVLKNSIETLQVTNHKAYISSVIQKASTKNMEKDRLYSLIEQISHCFFYLIYTTAHTREHIPNRIC